MSSGQGFPEANSPLVVSNPFVRAHFTCYTSKLKSTQGNECYLTALWLTSMQNVKIERAEEFLRCLPI